jgi:hypothetical protein
MGLVDFKHADQHIPDEGTLPEPLTWDYAVRLRKRSGYYACQSELDLALCTCVNQHTTRMTGKIHRIAADGTVSPSYVCSVRGCPFHEFVRLVGWDPTHVFEETMLDVD